MYTNERALVDRMQGKPFVLLGVNGDGDKDQLRELMKKKGINWRSWWDGGGSANTPGPIARRYNVHGWPTLYVLDHRGIIRYKPLGYPGSQRFDSRDRRPRQGRGSRGRRPVDGRDLGAPGSIAASAGPQYGSASGGAASESRKRRSWIFCSPDRAS